MLQSYFVGLFTSRFYKGFELCMCNLIAFLWRHFISRKQRAGSFPSIPQSYLMTNSSTSSVSVGRRSETMSLLASLEQASCVELACYQAVQYIFGTARWRTTRSVIDLLHYRILTTSVGARDVFPSEKRHCPDHPVSLFGWTKVARLLGSSGADGIYSASRG